MAFAATAQTASRVRPASSAAHNASSTSPVATIRLSPRDVVRLLGGMAVIVVTLALAIVVARHGFGYEGTTGFGRLFTLDAESNLPTWFSSMILAVAAVLLWLLGRRPTTSAEPLTRYWYGLATIFALLSLDETAQVHESLNAHVGGVVQTSGPLYYGWVIPAGLFVAAIGLAYLRFLRRLPARTARGMILAGGLYVGGALGMEMVGAWLDSADIANIGSLTYTLVTIVEESLEMIGVILFIYVLVDYTATTGAGAVRSVGRSPGQSRDAGQVQVAAAAPGSGRYS